MTILIDIHADRVIAIRHASAHRASGVGERDAAREEIGDAQGHHQSQRHGDPTGPAEFQEEPAHGKRDGSGDNDQCAEFQLQR